MRALHPITLILAALGWNYARHRTGKSTICSTSRRYVPWPVFCLALGWFVPHWLVPKFRDSSIPLNKIGEPHAR